jgi:chemotaxis protein MotB
MAEDATLPTGLDASNANPWALSAARAAAVAQALEEKCAVPAAQLSATGNGKHDPLQAQLANLKAAERIAIEFRSR